MSQSKIAIKIGQIEFTGEAEQEWLAKQLDKILSQAEKLIKIAPIPPAHGSDADAGGQDANDKAIASQTLAAFLKSKNANKNQNKKFLATAVWLQAKGATRLETKQVTKALRDASQPRIGNAADTLSQNIGKGYCEKDGNQFFVTDEGRQSL